MWCSMKNGEYELVRAPVEYPGKLYRGKYVYEHHLVWWKNTYELLLPGEVIHHKDHNKRNNAFTNLEKTNNKTHSKLHSEGRSAVLLDCAFCGEPFIREKRNVLVKQRYGQRRFYCSRSHAVKAQHLLRSQ